MKNAKICSESDKSFEDFMAGRQQADIFQKVADLSRFLDDHPQQWLDGLGFHLEGPAGARAGMRDNKNQQQDVIMLGSNSYLSLTTHPQVVAASKAACDKYGYGMGAVSLYAGRCELHRELEELIADFYGTEDAIIFPCGYSGNVGVLSAICGAGDVIVNDAANHASLFDGALLSGAEIKIYLHRNMKHLEKVLKRLPADQKGRLIVTDGVFSMDGDVAPLDEICELAQHYGARVMVDDAHGLGVVGPTGRGVAERYGCMEEIDIVYGTLSKAPAAVGGYCAGSAELVRYLRYYARTYFFSTSLPAPVVGGLIEVFKLLQADAAGREKLWENIDYLLSGLNKLGFDTGNTSSAIIPLIIGDEETLGLFHQELFRRGVFTNIVSYPAVRRKECRLRINVMSSLTIKDLDHALAAFNEVGKMCGVV